VTRYGAWANRNAGHKARRARRFALAASDGERLAAAYDWFRSSAGLLARRRTPNGIDQKVHEAAAGRLVREMTDYLKSLAEAIDRGDYDAIRVTRRDNHR
jgi:hypothetical protein